MRKFQLAAIAVLLSLCTIVGVSEAMSGGGHVAAVASTIAAPIPGGH